MRHFPSGDQTSADTPIDEVARPDGSSFVLGTHDRVTFGTPLVLLKVSVDGSVLWEAAYERTEVAVARQLAES